MVEPCCSARSMRPGSARSTTADGTAPRMTYGSRGTRNDHQAVWQPHTPAAPFGSRTPPQRHLAAARQPCASSSLTTYMTPGRKLFRLLALSCNVLCRKLPLCLVHSRRSDRFRLSPFGFGARRCLTRRARLCRESAPLGGLSRLRLRCPRRLGRAQSRRRRCLGVGGRGLSGGEGRGGRGDGRGCGGKGDG